MLWPRDSHGPCSLSLVVTHVQWAVSDQGQQASGRHALCRLRCPPPNPCRRMAPRRSSLTSVVVPPRRHAKLGTPRPRPDGRMTRSRFVGRYRSSCLLHPRPRTRDNPWGQGPLLWAFSSPPLQDLFCQLGQAIYRSPRLAIQVSAHPSCWCHALIEYITRDSPHHRPPTHHLPSDILITYRCKLGPYAVFPTRTVHHNQPQTRQQSRISSSHRLIIVPLSIPPTRDTARESFSREPIHTPSP